MVIVRIWGGLGNQMFQYAAGYALSRKANSELILDTSFYNYLNHSSKATHREYGLDKLHIGSQNTFDDISKFNKKIHYLQNPYVSYILRKLSKCIICCKDIYYIKETRLQYLPYVNDYADKNVYLDGYWHSEKYFSDFRKDILKIFAFTSNAISVEYNRLVKYGFELVAVHVRRGDYISDNNPNAKDERYYLDAMKMLLKEKQNLIFCMFSDDIDYIRKTFDGLDNIVIANEDRKLTDAEEMQLMRLCDHQIISNSSFSWWAAWLNENEEKMVVAPSKWENKRDMMPASWLRC